MIYDCFMFFDELDALDIRLHELGNTVDKFVLVESRKTLSGVAKPLYYSDNKSRFSAFADKIIHVDVEGVPGEGSWDTEFRQRDSIARGLGSCTDDDTIIISDADEIISDSALRHYLEAHRTVPATAVQMFAYYYLNCINGGWGATRLVPFKAFRAQPRANVWRHSQPEVNLADGGWHFSYLGGTSAIKRKLQSFAHTDLNRPPYTEDWYIRVAITGGIDLFQRDNSWRPIPLDDRFPRHVRQNIDQFRHLVNWGYFHENWYGDQQLLLLAETCRRTTGRGLTGVIIEMGCWEGRSTIALANAMAPEKVIAVDTWNGNADEAPDHISVQLARKRNVFEAFQRNIQALTPGNVEVRREDCHHFLSNFEGSIRFAHIDASHDYQSVRKTLEAVLPKVQRGGIICGDDFAAAGAQRTDLQGGVERAVRELLPGFAASGNFWWWERS